MCGISGIFNFRGCLVDPSVTREMARLQQHRGPDYLGIFKNHHVALAHNRLSIIDLREISNQPMSDDSGRYTIVYNGEIYNYRALRKQLEDVGYNFATDSDTEVVLLAFSHYGVNCFQLFNGMFALCVYDKHSDKLYLSRDRYGIKPLYISQTKNDFIFASELNSILKSGVVRDQVSIESSSLVEYLWYGTSFGNNTFYKEISELAPGSWLEVSSSGVFEHKYYAKDCQRSFLSISDSQAASELKNHLEVAVQRQLVSDVPLGVFLSGGVDSSAIVAFAAEKVSRLKTYSVEFDYAKGGELEAAAKTAKEYGTEHHEIRIRGANIRECIETLNFHHGQPFADAANIPLYLMTKAISNEVKVVLQGDGGDELFGGYSIYRTMQQRNFWRLLAWAPNLIRALGATQPSMLRLSRFLSAIAFNDPAVRNARLLTVETNANNPCHVLSDNLKQSVIRQDPFKYFKELYCGYPESNNDLDNVFLTDQFVQLKEVFLPKVDRATMANSVEVRVPFLDNDLFDFAMSLPAKQRVRGGEQKYLLKVALNGVVREEILRSHKKGFGVPYGEWLKNDLKSSFLENLNTKQAEAVINPKVVNKLFSDHCDGRGYNSFLLWKVFILLEFVNKDKNFYEALY